MARRSARRTYVRDGRGRFASTGTTTAKAKPAARRAQRGTNRITRDNSGKITGVGKNGATARGGRLRTAAGNRRGAVLDRLRRAPMAGTVGRGGKVRGGVKGVAVAKPAAPAKSTTKPKRQTKQQKADAYVERIKRIGEGRTGTKAKRAARIRESAASFASGLAGFHKRQKAKTREELKKGLSEAFGNQKRMKAYSNFVGGIGYRSRPQSGKRSLVRPGQVKRAQERLGQIAAAVRAPYSRWSPNPARQNPAINRRSSETVRMASEWYQGSRPAGKVKPRTKPVLMPQPRAKAATAARRPAKTRQDKAAQAMRLASRAAARSQSPKLSKAAALRSEKLSASLRARAKQLSQRPTLSRAQRDKAARARKDYGVKSTGTKGKKGAAATSGAIPSGRTVYRTSAQAIRAQQARTNTLGKATAAKRGFNEAVGSRRGFVDSAPRTVISRPRIPQLSLSGRVERVGAGRFRTIGERLGGGSIRRPRSKPGPLRGTKAWKRQLEQLIKANGGKDVAAFRP